MNEKQAEAMLKSIKRIEALMEAIDWKLWNFHQKVLGNTEEVAKPADDETEELAAVIEKPQAKPAADKAEKKAGFPSVEKWS